MIIKKKVVITSPKSVYCPTNSIVVIIIQKYSVRSIIFQECIVQLLAIVIEISMLYYSKIVNLH